MTKLVTLATFYDVSEAHVVRGLLEQNGIPAFLPDQHFLAAGWHFLFPARGMRLSVFDSDLEAARALIAEKDENLMSGGVDTCPECGSGNVFRGASGIAATIGVFLGMFVAASTAIPLILSTRGRLCRACGHKWTVDPT